jgi:hypothetical protein
MGRSFKLFCAGRWALRLSFRIGSANPKNNHAATEAALREFYDFDAKKEQIGSSPIAVPGPFDGENLNAPGRALIAHQADYTSLFGQILV